MFVLWTFRDLFYAHRTKYPDKISRDFTKGRDLMPTTLGFERAAQTLHSDNQLIDLHHEKAGGRDLDGHGEVERNTRAACMGRVFGN